jgi:hypothetical protein
MQTFDLDFFVIGVQKSATTWLYDCLREHPGVGVPDKKRDPDYLGGTTHQQKGDAWFYGQFRHQPGLKMGDVSVDYLYDLKAAQTVHQYAPKAKLVASLRDPIERAFSAYFWTIRKGKLPNVSVDEGLRRAVDAYQNNKRSTDVERRYCQLIERGFYDDQLNSYLRVYPAQQLMVFLFEDVRKDAAESLRRVLTFVGADPNFVPKSLHTKPKVNLYYRPLIQLERLAPESRVMGKMVDKLSGTLKNFNLGADKPKLSAEVEEQLVAIYRPHMIALQTLLDKLPEKQRPMNSDLSSVWKRYKLPSPVLK